MEINLENFDEQVHQWQSVAEEPLPLKSHKFDPETCSFLVLDQRLLPQRTEFVAIECLQDGFDAIKEMKVRGAPLIATVGMLTLLVEQRRVEKECQKGASSTPEEFAQNLEANCQFLLSARPTAINLANAFEELRAFVQQQILSEYSISELENRVHNFVLDWQARERRENDRLLRNSVIAVRGAVKKKQQQKLVAMTICNTGQLATSSFGTALGVLLLLHRLGHLELVIVLETRPYNQGSRLTAYELQQSGVPFRLIPDSAAASAMRHFGVDFVVAGADQVALNGDTANKIGTYALAIAARHHCIPFFICTPMSSVNARLADGNGIRVEERPAAELTHWNGQPTSPPDCPVWNPAFDITPGALVSGFLTECGNFKAENLLAKGVALNGLEAAKNAGKMT